MNAYKKAKFPNSLHMAARELLEKINAAGQDRVAEWNMDQHFVNWKAYIARHKEAKVIIGPGVVRAFPQFFPKEKDANPRRTKRLDLVVQRIDDTFCRIHPGGRSSLDAIPLISSVHPDSGELLWTDHRRL